MSCSCETLQTVVCQASLGPWDFPGKNTGAGCHFLLQGILLTQGWNPRLLHWQVESTTGHQGRLAKWTGGTEQPTLSTCSSKIINLSLWWEIGLSQVALMVKNLPANAGDTRDACSIPTSGRYPGVEMATHSRILAWRILWTEEPGGLSMGSQKVENNWSHLARTHNEK